MLARKAGVSVKGKVVSCNGSNDFTVTLYKAGSDTVVGMPLTVSGNGTVGSTEQEFTIPNVAPGTYDLVVTKSAHLKYTVKNVVVETTDIDLTAMTEKPFSTITLPAGDVNGDGTINSKDLNEIWSPANYLKNVTAVGVDPLADLNGDGTVNSKDLNIVWLAENYLKSASQCEVIY